MSKIAIQLIPNGKTNQFLIPFRKYTNLGITEIKTKMENKDFFAKTDANNLDDMRRLGELVHDLLQLGVKVKIFDSDVYGEGIFQYQEITYQEFMNNMNQLQEIMEELQDYDDDQ